MYAPKPAICGNGHAAMVRRKDVDTHLMEEEKKTQQKQSKKSNRTKT